MHERDREKLSAIAWQVRKALEACRHRLPIQFRDFPKGACDDARIVLAYFFERAGETGFERVSGKRGSQTHAWLEKEYSAVDITADQFWTQQAPVFVGDPKGWHSSFREQERRPATALDPRIREVLAGAIETVRSYVEGLHGAE